MYEGKEITNIVRDGKEKYLSIFVQSFMKKIFDKYALEIQARK